MEILFNDIMSLTMKGTTDGCVAHKFSANFYRRKNSANKCKIFCLLIKQWKVVKVTFFSVFV